MNFYIDPDLVSQRMAKPHEPIIFPSDAEREDFSQMVWQRLVLLRQLLHREGYQGSTHPLEAVDFYMNDDVGSFRNLSFTVTSQRLINSKTIPMLADFLRSLDAGYSIVFTCDIDDSHARQLSSTGN